MKTTEALFLKGYFKALIDNEQKLRDVALEGGRHTSIECLDVIIPVDLNCGWCYNLQQLKTTLCQNYPVRMRYFNFTYALVLHERLLTKMGLDKLYPVSADVSCPCAQYAVGPLNKWGEGDYAERRWELVKAMYAMLDSDEEITL